MAELREALQALVDQPLERPPSTDLVAARGAHLRRRRRRARLGAAGVALVALGPAVGLGIARLDDDDRLVVAMEGATTAGYIAENPGGYVATGVWSLTITRGGQVIELSSTSNDYCGPIGVIQPGDEVRGAITGEASLLRAGERFACPN